MILFFSSTTLFAQNTTNKKSDNHSSPSIRNPKSEIRNSLTVSPTQNPSHFPYRDATLTVINTSPVPVAAVRLRWREGGPAMQFPLAIPPGKSASREIFLPALSGSQTYDIDLLPDDEFTAQPAGSVSADIQWPVNLLTKDAFLDPVTWRACYRKPQHWSNTTQTSALFLGVVILLAFWGVLLVRRREWRLAIWCCLVGCSLTAGLVWLFFFGGGVLREETLPGGLSGKRVQARRTGEYYLRGIGPQNAPVYAHPDDIRDETLIVHPEKALYLTLRPNETRIFLERSERE